MNVLESVWFILAVLINTIILIVDPKSSDTGSTNSSILNVFSSPSSGQRFVYRSSAILITVFLILTVLGYQS